MSETIPFWVALTRIEGLGIRGCHKLIEHFGSPQAAYMASLTELESCGVPARVAQAIFAQAALKDAEKEVQEVAKADCELIAFDSEEYPPLLKQIPDAPLLLYVRGDVEGPLAVCGGGGGIAAAQRLRQFRGAPAGARFGAAPTGGGERTCSRGGFRRAPGSAGGQGQNRGRAGFRH